MTGAILFAYIAATPSGAPIISTIRQSPDEAWLALRRAMSDPDSLADNGWHVRRVSVSVGERVDDDI